MFSLQEFCETCREPSTTKAYRLSLCHFFETIYRVQPAGRLRTPKEIDHLDQLSLKYLNEDREHSDDLLKYVVTTRNLSPKTQRRNISVIKNWLETNHKDIRREDWRRINNKMPKNRALTQDTIISIEIVKQFYQHMGLQARALTLVLMSSGMRIGEALKITLADIDFNSSPVEIYLKEDYTKTKDARYTFISSEAASVLKDWLKVRDAWLQSSINRVLPFGRVKKVDDPRVFPVSAGTVSMIYNNGLKKAGLWQPDENTHRNPITPHSFRKFFFSQMKTAMTSEIVEMLGGHAGYLTDAYRRYPKDQAREEYLNAEYIVCLNAPIDMKEVMKNKDALNALASENARWVTTVSVLKAEMVERDLKIDAKIDRLFDAQNAIEKHRRDTGL